MFRCPPYHEDQQNQAVLAAATHRMWLSIKSLSPLTPLSHLSRISSITTLNPTNTYVPTSMLWLIIRVCPLNTDLVSYDLISLDGHVCSSYLSSPCPTSRHRFFPPSTLRVFFACSSSLGDSFSLFEVSRISQSTALSCPRTPSQKTSALTSILRDTRFSQRRFLYRHFYTSDAPVSCDSSAATTQDRELSPLLLEHFVPISRPTSHHRRVCKSSLELLPRISEICQSTRGRFLCSRFHLRHPAIALRPSASVIEPGADIIVRNRSLPFFL